MHVRERVGLRVGVGKRGRASQSGLYYSKCMDVSTVNERNHWRGTKYWHTALN